MIRQSSASVFLAALGAFALIPSEGEARGIRCRGCDTSCSAPSCAPVVCEAPPPPKMKEVQVTCYRPVWKDKEITETVCKRVPRQENYTCVTMVPVYKDVVRKVTRYDRVCEEVDTTWTVMVPKCYPETRTVKYCEWETKHVTEQVPVCRMVPVKCVDECGRCCTKFERVTEMCNVTRCVRTPIYKTREVTVNVVKCEPVVHKGKKMVVKCVPVVTDVTCKVCTYERKETPAVRTVYDTKTETIKRTIKVCEMEAYTKTVQVQECAPVSCNGGSCGPRFGLFRRGGCCN